MTEPDIVAMLDVAHHGILVTDADDQVVYANALLRGWLRNDEILGTPAVELFVPDERGRIAQRASLRQFGVSEEYRTHLATPGAPIEVRISATPRFDDSGQFVGTTAIMRDLSEPHAEDDLVDAGHVGQHVLNRFLTPGVAHALNTALQAVLGYAGLIVREEQLPQRVQGPSRRLHAAAIACARLVENLSSLAERQGDRPPVPRRIATLLDEALSSREVYLPANNVAVLADYEREGGPWVLVEESRARRALAHIMGNAAELALSRGGGSLELLVDATDELVGVTMAVHGATYPSALVNYNPSDVRPGLDPMVLGHAVAVGLIAELGGEMVAENTGDAASVHFTLPRVEPPAVTDTPARQASTDSFGSSMALDARVLVIDDEEFILDLNRRALGGMLDVVTASSADDAYELLQSAEFDLIVSDLRMPGALDGMGLYRWAARKRPEVARRMVFTTADTASGPALDFLVQSRRPFITKPYDVSDYRAFMLRELSRQEPEE